jgi:hypothetical protein
MSEPIGLKPTRFNRQGFREARCPNCLRWVEITSIHDDTRWRYGKHQYDPSNPRAECLFSRQLVGN